MSSFRFLHISDLHYLTQYAEAGFEGILGKIRHPSLNLRDCLRAEKALGLDFVLITGDLTQEGSTSDFMALKTLLQEELDDIPFYALPGNHDPREAFCTVFLQTDDTETTDRMYYHHGLRIITLDTGKGITGIVSKGQIAWLKEMLSAPAEEGTLLALHHPLFNQDDLGYPQYDSELIDIIASSDIAGIFCGHTHHNFAAQFAEKPYYTADSMAYALSTQGETMTFECLAAYNRMVLTDKTLFTQVKLVAPAPAVAARFSMDRLSELLSK